MEIDDASQMAGAGWTGGGRARYRGLREHVNRGLCAPGQAKGNGINQSGGIWHEMTASGAAAAAS